MNHFFRRYNYYRYRRIPKTKLTKRIKRFLTNLIYNFNTKNLTEEEILIYRLKKVRKQYAKLDEQYTKLSRKKYNLNSNRSKKIYIKLLHKQYELDHLEIEYIRMNAKMVKQPLHLKNESNTKVKRQPLHMKKIDEKTFSQVEQKMNSSKHFNKKQKIEYLKSLKEELLNYETVQPKHYKIQPKHYR